MIPPAFTVAVSLTLGWGARKYGPRNWRADPIRTSTYTSAMERHIALFKSGEDVDPETGVHHLAHVAAGAAIQVDVAAAGTLRDDRTHCPATRAALEAGQALMASWPQARHEVHG